MRTKTVYQNCKNELKTESILAKKLFQDDKPKVRMIINDYCDYLCKNYDLSDYHRNNLVVYSCTLHPKK